MLTFHGPVDSRHLVVFAPGDAGALSDPAPLAVSQKLTAAGVRVVRFAAPAGRGLDDSARDALWHSWIRQGASTRAPSQRLVLAGMSRGARVSAALVEELRAVGFIGLAYPFHGRHDPDPHGRERAIAALRVPVILCQGTRDSLGNRPQIEGYGLPSHVEIHWVEEANHALQPRPRSGRTQGEALAAVAQACAAFVQRLP